VRSLAVVLLALAIGVVIAGCGGDEPESNLVEAREANSVELGGMRYRIVIFRQLNPRIAPDRALWEGPLPGKDRGLFAAFLQVCNISDRERVPTPAIHLEDAFGQVYQPLGLAPANELAYRPRPLGPGRCLPPEESVASRALPGSAIVFAVPFSELGERPFILELRGVVEDGPTPIRRVQLDL